jgi:hypothetical protein
VSYQVRADNSLRYKRASNADGTAFGSEVTVASGADLGNPSVLKFINSLPYIAYHDDTNLTLRLIIGADANGSSWLASNLLDSGPDGAGYDIDMVAIGTKAGIGYSAVSGATDVAKFAFVP